MILAAINTILNSSADLKAYTGEQIYAVNIDQDVKGNMVVFNSETLPEDTKGGNAMDVDMLVIACVSPTYRTAAMIQNHTWNFGICTKYTEYRIHPNLRCKCGKHYP